MLYKNGIPIWLILLIYGIRFGITGFITPLFITLSSKLGIAKCNLISNIFGIISSCIIMNSTDIKRTLILFIIVIGLNGLSNPLQMLYQVSMWIKNIKEDLIAFLKYQKY